MTKLGSPGWPEPYGTGPGSNATLEMFSLMMRALGAHGVVKSLPGPTVFNADPLAVYADGSGMNVKVRSGFAYVLGLAYSNDAEETLSIASADPTNPRIDRVVLRADRGSVGWFVDTRVLTGTPAGSPVAPTLTQTATVWELPMARVQVDATVGVIAAGKTTDERLWAADLPGVSNAALAEPVAWLGAANLITPTAFVSNSTYLFYIGRAKLGYTQALVNAVVATAAATITWAEVGVFKGAFINAGAATLTRVGWTNVAATFNTTGPKVTTVPLVGVAPGDDLWIAFGSQATTAYQLRGGLAFEQQDGSAQQRATTRISTVADATLYGQMGSTLALPYFTAALS